MRGFAAIVRRELGQRRLVWIAAVLAAAIPFLLPVAKGFHGLVAREARAATAVCLALAFLYGLSCFLAATVIPVGIATRRIGFDFSRPVSPFAIWGGTLIAIATLAAGAASVVALPAALADRSGFADALRNIGAETPITTGLAIGGFLLLAAVLQAGSLALRSRSFLILVDFALLVGFVFAVASGLQMLAWRMIGLVPAAVWGVVVIAALAVLAGTLAAVAGGRTDVRRAHRFQSLALWSCAFIGLAVGWLWILRMISLSPNRMTSVAQVHPDPRGSWATVWGSAGKAPVAFLWNSTSEGFLRLQPFMERPTYASSGKVAGWLDVRGDIPALATVDLDRTPHRPVRVPIHHTEPLNLLLLSPSGGRAAISNGREIEVLNVADGKTIASRSLPRFELYPRGAFFGEDIVRIVSVQETAKEIYRVDLFSLDIATSRLSHTGTIDAVEGWPYSFSTDASGEHLLIKARRMILLADAREGRRIAILSQAPEGFRNATFVSDGRIVLAENAGTSGSLSCLTADGASVWSVPLPGAAQVNLGGEIRSGELVVGVGPYRDQEILLANLATGALRRIAEHLSPVGGWANFFAPLDARPAPGEPATRLFYGPDESLVQLDPETGSKRVLLGGSATK